METLRSTDWEAIQKRYEASKLDLEYMSQHPLSYSEAVAQTQKLHEVVVRMEDGSVDKKK